MIVRVLQHCSSLTPPQLCCLPALRSLAYTCFSVGNSHCICKKEAHFELHPRISCNKFVARSFWHVTRTASILSPPTRRTQPETSGRKCESNPTRIALLRPRAPRPAPRHFVAKVIDFFYSWDSFEPKWLCSNVVARCCCCCCCCCMAIGVAHVSCLRWPAATVARCPTLPRLALIPVRSIPLQA